MTLAGKTALVVGGGTGIGASCAEALANAEVQVLIGGRRPEPLQEIAKSHSNITSRRLDVTDRDSVAQFFDYAKSQGRIDICLNCAGVNIANRSLADLTPEDWDRLMSINATGSYNVMQAVLPTMRDQADGLIINISSVAGLRAMEVAGAAYCASKFAVSALGTYAGLEEGKHGIRVTTIFPGEVETAILDQRPEPVSAERRAQILQPADIAAAVLFVANLPARAHIPDLVIKPTIQQFA